MEKEEVLLRIEFSKYRNFQYISSSILLNKGSLKNLQYNACYNHRKPFSSFSCSITLLHIDHFGREESFPYTQNAGKSIWTFITTLVLYFMRNPADRYYRYNRGSTESLYMLPVSTAISLDPWQAALT